MWLSGYSEICNSSPFVAKKGSFLVIIGPFWTNSIVREMVTMKGKWSRKIAPSNIADLIMGEEEGE
jgi:hypothetical protein